MRVWGGMAVLFGVPGGVGVVDLTAIPTADGYPQVLYKRCWLPVSHCWLTFDRSWLRFNSRWLPFNRRQSPFD